MHTARKLVNVRVCVWDTFYIGSQAYTQNDWKHGELDKGGVDATEILVLREIWWVDRVKLADCGLDNVTSGDKLFF